MALKMALKMAQKVENTNYRLIGAAFAAKKTKAESIFLYFIAFSLYNNREILFIMGELYKKFPNSSGGRS